MPDDLRCWLRGVGWINSGHLRFVRQIGLLAGDMPKNPIMKPLKRLRCIMKRVCGNIARCCSNCQFQPIAIGK